MSPSRHFDVRHSVLPSTKHAHLSAKVKWKFDARNLWMLHRQLFFSTSLHISHVSINIRSGLEKVLHLQGRLSFSWKRRELEMHTAVTDCKFLLSFSSRKNIGAEMKMGLSQLMHRVSIGWHLWAHPVVLLKDKNVIDGDSGRIRL